MMTWYDAVNGAFELCGAWFTWRNAWQLYLDKEVKGVYWAATGFFALWGLWNIIFYAQVDAPLSWMAGLVLVGGNIAWVALYLRYRK